MVYNLSMGRPSTYSQETADLICERLAGGESLLQICLDDGMPPQSVVFQWLLRETTFQENYTRARQFWAEAEFERMMHIADTPQVGQKTKEFEGKVEITTGDMTEHRKLQVDARKWALARMSPRKYGDLTKLEHSGPGGKQLNIRVTGFNDDKDKGT